MANFCQNCGNKLKSTDKFCTKCGTPVTVIEQNKQTPISSENIQETVENLKETVGNVSTVVKEKAKQAVQQSQEYLQSEEFQNTKENVIEKAKQAAQYSKDIVQNEEFRNEQADALKEKAKQAHEYLKSEEFQNAKAETVNKTKGFIKNFFSCNINSNDDYIKAEKQCKCSLYTIFVVIAAVIALFPFYDKWYWLNDGLWKSILHLLSILSVISKVVIIPVSIIALIKYYIIHTKVIEYRAINPDMQKQGINGKKTLSVLLVSVVVCLVMTPIMNKVHDNSLHNYSSSDSSSSYSSLVEECNSDSGLQFKLTVDEYIDKYNKNNGNLLSKETADVKQDGEVLSYAWSLGKDRYIQLIEYNDTKKLREVRYCCLTSNFNSNPKPFINDTVNAFNIIDDTIDVDAWENIVHNRNSSSYYYDDGICYSVGGNNASGQDIYICSMLAATKEIVENLYGSAGSSDNMASNSSTNSSSSDKYIKDDSFIEEYLAKINIGYEFKVEDTDVYNRYIVVGTAEKEYAHLPEQLIVYLAWIDKNHEVHGNKKSATVTSRKYELVSEMRNSETWDKEPF